MEPDSNILIGKDIWVPLAAALVGGVLSLLGSFIALRVANKNSVKQENEAEKKRRAELAYGAFHKLLEAYNSAANLQRQIDEMFENADKTGGGELEPWAKVTELVGADQPDSTISPTETAFLIEAKRAELLNEVHLIDRRLKNIEACSSKYNEIRSEFWTFVESNSNAVGLSGGTKMAAELQGKPQKMAEMREVRMNNLLGQLMNLLDQDLDKAWSVIDQFHSAATKHFGSRYPKFKLEKATM